MFGAHCPYDRPDDLCEAGKEGLMLLSRSKSVKCEESTCVACQILEIYIAIADFPKHLTTIY